MTGKSYEHRAVYLHLMPERFMLLPNRLLCAALSMAMALLAGACASVDVGGAPGPSVAAPQYRVGDKWVYHIVDGYRAKDGANRAVGKDVTLADGRRLFLGGSALPTALATSPTP